MIRARYHNASPDRLSPVFSPCPDLPTANFTTANCQLCANLVGSVSGIRCQESGFQGSDARNQGSEKVSSGYAAGNKETPHEFRNRSCFFFARRALAFPIPDPWHLIPEPLIPGI
jgi:hypothetical protein